MLAISGQVGTKLEQFFTHQVIDHNRLYAPITSGRRAWYPRPRARSCGRRFASQPPSAPARYIYNERQRAGPAGGRCGGRDAALAAGPAPAGIRAAGENGAPLRRFARRADHRPRGNRGRARGSDQRAWSHSPKRSDVRSSCRRCRKACFRKTTVVRQHDRHGVQQNGVGFLRRRGPDRRRRVRCGGADKAVAALDAGTPHR